MMRALNEHTLYPNYRESLLGISESPLFLREACSDIPYMAGGRCTQEANLASPYRYASLQLGGERGELIEWAEAGPFHGRPILVNPFVGQGGNRTMLETHQYAKVAEKCGLRFICINRPGAGKVPDISAVDVRNAAITRHVQLVIDALGLKGASPADVLFHGFLVRIELRSHESRVP